LYRLIAGLGFGGATPCFITMAAEYAPSKKRAHAGEPAVGRLIRSAIRSAGSSRPI
jgi:MFS family permease